MLPCPGVKMAQIDLRQLGLPRIHHVAQKHVVDFVGHVVQPGAHKKLARHMAQKTTLQVGAVGRIDFIDDAGAVRAVGDEPFECSAISVCQHLDRADAGAQDVGGQCGQYLPYIAGWAKEFVNIDMGQPVHLGFAGVGVGGVPALAHLMLDRALATLFRPERRIAGGNANYRM